MYNVMLDLEAFDSKRTAAIVSIGAVYFDFDKQELGEKFYIEISQKGIQKQFDLGRTWSLDTFIWWQGQSDGARNVFLKNNHEKQDVVHALHKFSEFCNSKTSEKRVRMWGNGVDYDNVVLRDTYETFGIGAPWKYGDNRCFRTIKNLFGNRAKKVMEGNAHNALDDAVSQANHLMAMMKKVHINE